MGRKNGRLGSRKEQVRGSIVIARPDKVLIIRSARLGVLRTALDQISERWNGAAVEIFTNSDAVPELSEFLRPDQIVVYPHMTFKISHILNPEIRRMIGKYRAVVILFNNLWGEGYRNVVLFGLCLGARECWSVNIGAEWRKLDLFSFIKTSFYDRFRWSFYFFYWIFSLFRFGLKLK